MKKEMREREKKREGKEESKKLKKQEVRGIRWEVLKEGRFE